MNEIRLSGAASLLGKGEAQKTLRVKDMKAGAPLGGCRQNGWKDSVAETGIPAAGQKSSCRSQSRHTSKEAG